MTERISRERAIDGDRDAHAGTQDVVARLETDIIFGRLHPRERLIEDELIERFGATRHRVRRAIGELVKRGLAVQAPNKGARVRDYSATEVEELYEMRNLLQGQAIRRMDLPLSRPVVARLRDLHEAHVAAGRAEAVEEVFRLNRDFHSVFFEACGNAVLAEAIETYAQHTHPIRSRGFFDPAYREAAQADHEKIVEAAAAGARETLLAIDKRHIERPKDLYLRQVHG